LNFPKGSRKSARIHNPFSNIQRTLSNHLAERQTIPGRRKKTFPFRAKKVVICDVAGIVIGKEFA